MKILYKAAVFFFIGWQSLNAQQNLSKMRVNYDAEPLPAIDAIELFLKQNNIQQFAYSKESLKNYKVQGVKCKNETVLNCLGKLLKDLPLETVINNNFIIIREKKSKSFGHLDSIENKALNDTISSETIAKRETKIEEVILNAGYYAVKDKESTGSIAKVTAKDIENQPVTNVLSSVQGRMAGVSIIQNGGTPGGGYQVQIRGRNSLRTTANSGMDGSQPLYVVDGVPIGNEMRSVYGGASIALDSINPLNSINPNDIESIEVLKDADATSIYGSRGANGVILITTKKGKSGRLSLNLNTNYGFSNVISNLKMMNTAQYLNMREQAFSNSGITNYPVTAYDINGTWDKNRYTDWRKKLIGNTADFSNVLLSLTGGNEQTNFLVSLSHNEQTTVFAHDFRYKTNNISTALSHRSSDNKFQLNINNLFSSQKKNVLNGDITGQVFLLPPNAPSLYKEDGSLNWENNTFSNPVAAYNGTYSYDNLQFLTNLTTRYELFPGLNVKLNAGINYQAFEEWALKPNTINNPAYISGQSSAYSTASKSNQNRLSIILEPQVNWHYKKERHEFDVLLGASYQQETNKLGSMKGTGFESNVFITNIAAAQTKTIGDQITNEYKYAAVFGRLNYQFDKKYILNVTGRRDGSSRFGPNNRFANFGAVGAAWIFSKEDFLENSKWLSFGKLRSSYGSTGSDNIGDYQFYDTYTVSSLIYNGVTGLIPSRLYNPDFSWEKTKKLEIALELAFFQNRINLTSAWYQNRSSSQLVGYQLPAVTGFASVLANLNATVQNTGLEFELSAKPLSSTAFKWETGFNISFPKNKLISFPGLEGSTYSNQFVIGQPTSIVKLYNLEGINPNTGQYIFTDYNGDGKITSADDRQVIGDLNVKFFGGFSNTFRYKNWDASILFQFVHQNSRNYNYVIPSPGIINNLPVQALDVWSPSNPNGSYMPYTASVNPLHSLFQSSTASYGDASFIRLKNVEIGYRIPLKESAFREVKIYIQGQNLVTWTKYFGIDPELGSGTFLPPLRSFSFGIQCNL
ncbi:SusC/RagA family TonB-linked outer membrane protein [Chryseobacterium indologenes]|uniref:SusC/RagA family TonB-linked outer membrane protein n=1 Tax=Chryseobacterium indologenes TaxID=253 RepID=UPI000B515A2A|nr:SusC/RagA family TonB-linked outer membrane protein [Chryseobacterium indologenes]ASE62031.1 SusC/RagA family TonB-linked outer membrane protein [Chryseobacterium indologenes]